MDYKNGGATFLGRSILEIPIVLSSFISVPEGHVIERRAGATAEPEVGPSRS